MNAEGSKLAALRALDFIRQQRAAGDDDWAYGSVGYAWATLARIADQPGLDLPPLAPVASGDAVRSVALRESRYANDPPSEPVYVSDRDRAYEADMAHEARNRGGW